MNPRASPSTSTQSGSSPRAIALAQEQLAGPDELLSPADEHLADAGLLAGLRPSPDEADLARRVAERVDRLDVVRDRRAQPVRRRRQRREPGRELVEALTGDQVATVQEQLVLAPEIGVDRADRQARSSDHIGDRGTVVALLGEHLDRGSDDPVADLLFMGGGDARHGGGSAPKRTDAPPP